MISGILFFCHYQYADAISTVTWDFPHHSSNGGAVNSFESPVTFTVFNSTLAGNAIRDNVTVLVNSTSYPTGITLTLTEDPSDNGMFTNTNLIFTRGPSEFHLTDIVNVNLNNTLGNFNATKIDHDPDPLNGCAVLPVPINCSGLVVFSTTDTGGIPFSVNETGPNTGIFSNHLHFSTGPSIVNSTIQANPGDIVSIYDQDTGQFQNWLIIPNPNPALGALPANDGDNVTAIYNGVKDTTSLDQSPFLGSGAPGGGGGGLIRPSLVLDILSSIGGSPYVVQPPSFGGRGYHFSDGLTFTQGKNKTTFDISHYNQDLQKQVMVTGEKINMTFKTFEGYNKVNGVVHMGLYLVPPGHDMVTTNSIASIEWDKGKPVKVNDPGKILHNANVSPSTDGTFQYTKFSFVPTKSYDKMSFLVRAWNDHMYSTDVRVHDAIDTPQPVKTLPAGVVMYDSFAKLQETLNKDKFYNPEILAHIHSANAVFPDLQGKVYWLYDTNEHSVTLVISDSEDNELFEHKGLLQPYEIEKKPDYGFMNFTTVQLNRQNVEQIQKALKSEEEKANASLIEMKIIRPGKW